MSKSWKSVAQENEINDELRMVIPFDDGNPCSVNIQRRLDDEIPNMCGGCGNSTNRDSVSLNLSEIDMVIKALQGAKEVIRKARGIIE